MQPIDSKYIHLIDSQLTLITTPWYKVINKQEADVIKWQAATLVTGCQLRDLGVEIKDSDICKFFDITTDLILLNTIKSFCSIYCLQALISVSCIDSTLNPSKQYTFIRPTKTGSSAIRKYFNEHYKEYITINTHLVRCNNSNNPIIVVRGVKSRFISMYKYWKNLSVDIDRCKRDLDFIEKHKDITVLDFISILKTDKAYLVENNKYMAADVYDNISAWIGDTDYKNIIIVKYREDLNESIQRLINFLGIENKNKPVEKIRISGTDNIKEELFNHPDVDDFIKEYFKDDIILIDAIEKTPELFKAVI